MTTYPSLDYYYNYPKNIHIYAFDKLDGSNIRFEWSRKRGFYKFGTKTVMIDEKTELFGRAISIFIKKYGSDLDAIFNSKKYKNEQGFICFGEFLGKKSEYGQHYLDDDFDVVLFDVFIKNKTFIDPENFILDFGHLDIPKVIYQGEFNEDFINGVKNNKFNLKEGVIAKGFSGTKKPKSLHYCKIKTNDWLLKLKEKYGERAFEEEFKKNKIK